MPNERGLRRSNGRAQEQNNVLQASRQANRNVLSTNDPEDAKTSDFQTGLVVSEDKGVNRSEQKQEIQDFPLLGIAGRKAVVAPISFASQ